MTTDAVNELQIGDFLTKNEDYYIIINIHKLQGSAWFDLFSIREATLDKYIPTNWLSNSCWKRL